MKRWLLCSLGLGGLLGAQVIVLPRFVPWAWRPDLILLTVVLWGFFVPDGRAGWLGLLLGGFQGWLHGTALLPLAFSRAFAGWLAGWLRRRWLWFSFPAGLFCLFVTTFLAEGLAGAMMSIGERDLAPFLHGWRLGATEAVGSVLLGGCLLWFRQNRLAL